MSKKFNTNLIAIVLLAVGFASLIITLSMFKSTGGFTRFMKNNQMDFNYSWGNGKNTKRSAVDVIKTLSTDNIKKVYIKTDVDSINVSLSDENEIKARFHGEINALLLDKIEFYVNKSGSTAEIEIREKSSFSGFSFIRNLNLDVTLPKTFVSDYKISSDTGSITVSDIKGSEFTISSDTGRIEYTGGNSKSLSVSSDTGSLEITNAESADSQFKTDTGSITINNSTTGKTKTKTSTGSTTIENSVYTVWEHKSDTGSLKTDNLKTEKSSFEISTGSVRFGSFIGEINGSTDTGSINISFDKFIGNIDLHADTGSVEAALPDGSEFNFEGSSDTGSVTCDFPLTIYKKSKSFPESIEGKSGNGRFNVKMKSGTGRISVTKR